MITNQQLCSSFLFVLVVLCCLTSLNEATQIKGVSPAMASKYSKAKQFKCIERPDISFPYSAINDDFCDCPDASDEPGTSACSNGKFWCANLGHKGHYIPSSQVGDGVCDCCDGSDEQHCQNECAKAGAELIRKQRKQLRLHREGSVVKQRWIESANTRYDIKLNEVKKARDIIEALDREIESLERERDRLEGISEKADLLINPDEDPDSAFAEQDPYTREDCDDDESAKGKPGGAIQFQNEHGFSPQEAKDKYEAAKEAVRNKETDRRTQQSIVDDMGNIENIDFGPQRAYFKLFTEVITYNSAEYAYTLQPFKKVKQGSFDLGSWTGWEEATGEDGEPNAYAIMKYENGQHCWGGPNRSTKVIITCGKRNEVISVEEPNKCEYEMRFKTPAACSEQFADQLQATLDAIEQLNNASEQDVLN